MNKSQAINLVKKTFENSYDKGRFATFAKNLFHSFEPKTFIYRGKYIPEAYKKQIKTLERIGKYEDAEGNKIDILAVKLTQESTLERARTLQRNFISWYLGSRGEVHKDGALVAFYVEDSSDWRLSLVKMEYRLDKTDSGRLRTYTELTPAKRFSFLVGENENTHTAQRQLMPILLEEDSPPTLSDLEKAFSVEVVTKEFFEKYKQLFLDTKEALDKIVKKDPQVKTDFEEKSIDTVDFTKKLLGQIVFLYFLQKKGWFGVARDEDWGSGPKEFLRLLFEKNIVDYKNFFNDILEPLFYEALAIERPDDFYSRFNCKIPFLNGGLFDPLNNYDWVHTDIQLPNHLFSNDKLTKEKDRGTGILDVFDRYNFTVKEDEPLEREVAVDPEMLGKVFENLLEVKDRKSKGTYYTPREIVHYMCQESLINYLVTELDGKVKKKDVETLVQIGEAAVEHDTRVAELEEETPTYSYKLPKGIRKHAKEIDKALVNIRVCDPAVGSGAFLVGMMTEIIRVRNTLTSYLGNGERSIYNFKHHAIQNSLYGVDIDPGATEIAKLRLWLSLIVDEQDIKRIKPLPNLDYKIMQGNSLLEEYEGIKLFDEELFSKPAFDNSSQIETTKERINELQREFFDLYKKNELSGSKKERIESELKKLNKTINILTKPQKSKAETNGLFDQMSEAKKKADELKKLHKEFFDTAHKKEKDKIKKQIESLTWELIEATLKEQKKKKLLKEIEKFKKTNIKPFFLWKLNFSEVFESNKGFDVVVANPPYVGEKGHKKMFREIRAGNLRTYYLGKMDLFYFFFHLAINLVKEDGIISFITTNYYPTATGARKLRQDFKERTAIINLVNFNELKIFDSALGQHNMLTFLQKSSNENEVASTSITTRKGTATPEILQQIVRGHDPETKYDQIKQKELYDGDENYIRLSGNSKHINDPKQAILDKVASQSQSLSEFCNVNQGIVTGADKVSRKHIKEFKVDAEVGDGIFVLSDDEIDKLNLTLSERQIMRPWYKNSDVNRWHTSLKTNEKVIYSNSETVDDIGNFIGLKNHLFKYKKITSRYAYRWHDLHRSRNTKIFNGPKIVAPQRSFINSFGYNEIPWYASADVYFITEKDEKLISLKYTLALLNSRIYYLWLYHRGKRKGEMLELYQKPLSEIPIKEISKEEQQPFIVEVDKILALTTSDDYQINQEKQKKVKEYEKQIDQMVYDLYDLGDEEIAIVEGKDKEND